jgi:hypothetical protein
MPKRRGGRVRKKIRRAQATVLIVGEGDTDVAFIKHLKRLYNVRGCGVSVTVRNAHGHGPENVIDVTRRQIGDYDRRAALLDTDMEWTAQVKETAKSKRIEMLPSDPCLEGLLLKIQEKSVPYRSDLCKKTFVHDDLKSRTWYQNRFPQELLEERRAKIPTLGRLIELLSCPK